VSLEEIAELDTHVHLYIGLALLSFEGIILHFTLLPPGCTASLFRKSLDHLVCSNKCLRLAEHYRCISNLASDAR
jgi:hypothetical protein